MLKKLLASTLAIATVASCAYVPSALASAATTYKTATAVEYQDWKLKNPTTPETKDTLSIYVSANTAAVTAGTYTLSVKPENNNADYVKANINDVTLGGVKLKDQGFGGISAADSTAAVKYSVEFLAPAGNNTYVAQIARKKAVVYSTYKAASPLTDVKAANLTAADVSLLGYYNYPDAGVSATDKASVLSELTQTKYTSQAKVAGKEFTYWSYVDGGAASDVVAPNFNDVTPDPNNIYYTTVNLVQSAATAYAEKDASLLTLGLYQNQAAIASLALPKADSASWTLAVTNYVKLNNAVADVTVTNDKGEATVYKCNNFRLVNTANNTYAATYAPVAKGAAKKSVAYTLNFVDENGAVIGQLTANKEDASNEIYTTDANEVYSFVKGNHKATLDEYLAKELSGNENVQYKWAGTYKSVATDTGAKTVTVSLNVKKYDKYTVYSFAANDEVKETTVFLNADQVKVTNNQIAATASELGVATEATVKGVPATYAYASKDTAVGLNIIYTTYKMGDATAAMADFETTVGSFDAKAYFGRDAKAGDVVTLKVALSDVGTAKQFNLSNVKVVYTCVGATAGENFVYSTRYSTDTYKDGVATEITLAEGTNIVTATVYYNGVQIGTVAPFYAYVG